MNLEYLKHQNKKEKCMVFDTEYGLCRQQAEYLIREEIEYLSDFSIKNNGSALDVLIFLCQEHKEKYTGCNDEECKCDNDTYCNHCVERNCHSGVCCCEGKASY